MFAVVDIKGHQFTVAVGDTVEVPKFSEEAGTNVSLDRVLLINTDGEIAVGKPTVEGASIQATIVEHSRRDKILGYKFKRRKGVRRTWGHKQPYTILKIDGIEN
jgi:large subunit ribosomal protein L21